MVSAGTGKSKTITAVLNYALSKGQKCLMVSEKKTAMEVIYQNLNRLGISEYVAKITDINVLYGGSVNAENSKGFFEQKYIDGALVGGASHDPLEFGIICINYIQQMELLSLPLVNIENCIKKQTLSHHKI